MTGRRDEAEQLKAANNSLRLELERFQGLETQLQVQLCVCACVQLKTYLNFKRTNKSGVINIIITYHHDGHHHHPHHDGHHHCPHHGAQVQKQRAEELGLVVAMKNDQLRQVEQILKRTFCGCFNMNL